MLAVLAGCGGRQSALSPAGTDAQALLVLFTVMLSGAVLLWLLMNGSFYVFTHRDIKAHPERFGRLLVIGGGIVLPTLIVSSLLVWGLSILSDQNKPGDGLRIAVTAEQWWWRVEYWPEGAKQPVVSANEIRLPLGERTEFSLTSAKVIHSFWIPALGGKMDMFPGRITRMSLEPDRPGLYRGQCAEFCGASHAWMAFEAVVMPAEDFAGWLEAEARTALPPDDDQSRRGRAIFEREGCGACHRVRGTGAVGRVGPDLTHVGSRHSIGAGRLGATLDDISLWITHTEDLKPEVRMPAYPDLDAAARVDLSSYLKGLQ